MLYTVGMSEFLFGLAVGLVPTTFLCFRMSRLYGQLAYWLRTISLMLEQEFTEDVGHVVDQRFREASEKGW